MIIRPLDKADFGYAFFTWREGAKKAPGLDRVPWTYYKSTVAPQLGALLDDPSNRVLGAYRDDKLVGWLAMTPGKRVHTVHWVHVKHELDGERMRRRGAMLALLDAAELGSRFIYTMRSRRDRTTLPDGSTTKSLDESLVAALRDRGVTATFVPMKEWLA
jgi:hypothetical protein